VRSPELAPSQYLSMEKKILNLSQEVSQQPQDGAGKVESV
jgi:hypothetical protein